VISRIVVLALCLWLSLGMSVPAQSSGVGALTATSSPQLSPTAMEGTPSPESTATVVIPSPSAVTSTTPKVHLTSPQPGAEVGGLVSILGVVRYQPLQRYELSFGAGEEPVQWIAIYAREGQMETEGRLAFWDTTLIPDGIYTLRLRVVRAGEPYAYQDVLVGPILVANAPRTPTPRPTNPPTATPTQTPTPTVTPTPMPTLALEDGASPYLYLTMVDLYDPLCLGWKQRYGVWVSNVGMVTVTNVILTDTLPSNCYALLEDSTEGAEQVDERTVVWRVEALQPGEARKFELQVEAPAWLATGQWLTNRVVASSDQLPYVARSESSLLSDCVTLKQTAAAQPVRLPTSRPTATITRTATRTLQVTARPTVTPLAVSVSEETVQSGLDVLTLVMAGVLGALLVLVGALVYQRVRRR
jgi:hypothetical protein